MNDDKKLRLREFMIKEKEFLKSLYVGNPLSNRSSLSFATNFQLNVLIRVLYYIVKGQIPMKRDHFEALTKSKKRGVLHSRLSKVEDLKKLIQATREEKLKFLNNFLSSYAYLLFLIFNQK